MPRIVVLAIMVGIVVLIYFFSAQLQKGLGKVARNLSFKLGTFSQNREAELSRYIYKKRGSLIAKFYSWVNAQLIASGLKQSGITPVGYCLFWSVIAIITTLLISFLLGLNPFLTVVLFFTLFAVFLIATRVMISGRMEKKEADIMDALDLIIPEIGDGVVNVIKRYADNFAPDLQKDFKMFLFNIQDNGMPFNQAMMLLADNLGSIFYDFAQKAIFFEELGEPDMTEIFLDITETNRQRRTLRYNNSIEFGQLRANFILSSVVTFGYFLFIIATDAFSRYFFFKTNLGNFLLVVILLVVFGVLSYISTIKSKSL